MESLTKRLAEDPLAYDALLCEQPVFSNISGNSQGRSGTFSHYTRGAHLRRDLMHLSKTPPRAEVPTGETPASSIPKPHVDPLMLQQQEQRLRGRMFGPDLGPDLLDQYVLIEEIGRGGMGVVYAAYDRELDRKVAIKKMLVQGSRAQQRFKREAKAMAKLSHPNVVSIYQISELGAATIIVMEFVEGLTLGQWLSKTHPSRAKILDIFTAAGRGLAAVHEAGLVHRDFKPDNVMVGGDGRVLVMDFGLAGGDMDPTMPEHASQSAAGMVLTQPGAAMGTPQYMAPEQWRGATVTHEADQFSYCVTLWQALCGEPPFEGSNRGQLREAVLSGRMTDVDRNAMPRWLRRVLLRGLDPDPRRRFESMALLLDSLERPRRRRRVTALMSGALLVGLSSAALTAWLSDEDSAPVCSSAAHSFVGVWDEARRAEVEVAISSTGLPFAPQTWSSVAAAFDDYRSTWVSAATDACEATQRGEQSSELLDRRMRCLNRGLYAFEALVDAMSKTDRSSLQKAIQAAHDLPNPSLCEDPPNIPPPPDSVRDRVDALEQRVASTKASTYAAEYAQSIAAAKEVVTEARELGYEPLLVRALLAQGGLQRSSGDSRAAEATLRQAYQLALRVRMMSKAASAASQLMYIVGGQNTRPKDSERWAFDAEPLSCAQEQSEACAEFLNGRGCVTHVAGDNQAARDDFLRALAIQEALLGPSDLSVATTLQNLGGLADYSLGNQEDARRELQRAITIFEDKFGESHPVVASAYGNLSNVALAQGRRDEAKNLILRVTTILGQINPKHTQMAIALGNLGLIEWETGSYDDAREHLSKSIEIIEALHGEHHGRVAYALGVRSIVEYDAKNMDAAREDAERCVAIYDQFVGRDHPEKSPALHTLGTIALDEGDCELAREYFTEAKRVDEMGRGPEHPTVAYSWRALGDASLCADDGARAIEECERALEILEPQEHSPVQFAKILFSLARALWDGPAAGGRDRPRARQLGVRARAEYQRGSEHMTGVGGQALADEQAKLEEWLRTHPIESPGASTPAPSNANR